MRIGQAKSPTLNRSALDGAPGGGSRRGAWAVAVALAPWISLLALSPRLIYAQTQSDPQSTRTLTLDQLKQRLEALRRELDDERAAAAQSQQRFADEAAALAERRKELADRLLSLEIERDENVAKLESLRAASGEGAARAKALSEQAASLAGALRTAAEQLRLHLTEVPGSDAEVERLRALAAALAQPLANASSAASVQAIEEFLAICEAAQRHAAAVSVTETEIFTADGQREPVVLLAAGHARFAYLASDGRVGVSLSSPADASGYRWTENLDADTQAAVCTAIEQCQFGNVADSGGGIVTVPLDPTGRLTVDAASSVSSVYEWFAAGGPVMIPLACVAVAVIALVLERTVFYFTLNPGAEKLASGVQAMCCAGEFSAAEQLCSQRRGVVARVLAACLAGRMGGQRAMEDGVAEQLLHELPKLQRFLPALATLAGVAPLLGLLGTVTGIIQTFSVIRSFGNTNPSLMAGGISEALITTALGLLIAVPAVIVHALLRSRSDRIVADAERHAATLLVTLVHRSAGGLRLDQRCELHHEPRQQPQDASQEEPQRTSPDSQRPRSTTRAAKIAAQQSPTAVRAAAKELSVDG